MLNGYNKIIREHFDISDEATRKCIIALEDGEQNQLLSAYSSKLYDMIVDKVDKIDFGTIPNSKGDITKVDGFENTIECLNLMRKIILEYKENTDVVDAPLIAIENIRNRKSIFMKAYGMNIEMPIVLYNLIVLSIEQSVSFLISVCIRYIKDPASQSIDAALDKVSYNNTRDNLLFEQLRSFNTSCSNGELDIVLNDVLKNGGKITESEYTSSGSIVDDIIATGGKVPETRDNLEPFSAPLINDFDSDTTVAGNGPKDNSVSPVNGDCKMIGDKPIQEGIGGIVATIASGASVIGKGISYGLQTIKFLLGSFIPMLRHITYFLINSRVKVSDSLAVQAQFLEANAYKLQYSTNTSKMDDNKRNSIVSKQLKIAEKLKDFSNRISIDNKKAEKEAINLTKIETRKMTIKDMKNDVSSDIYTKGVLF